MDDGRQNMDVTVLCGGPSAERAVSLSSGAAVVKALQEAGHRVTSADISPRDTSALDRPGIDVVFIALHGEFGESGEVQALCEERGLAYTGSGPMASRLGMDKAATKQCLLRAGLSTPDWMIIESWHDPVEVRDWLTEIAPPVVVKPVDGGSSVDITICRDAATRDDALEELTDLYDRAMLERFVPGRELTVSVLGETALPVLEIVPDGAFYDYRAKYDDSATTTYRFDHGLDSQTVAHLQADALEAHRCLGCRDLSRVDFILDDEGVGQILEINTIPGFTSHSLLPKAAQQMGINMPTLVDTLLQRAVQRTLCQV
jgi:D-alanine-D-alanine ligase